MVKRLAGLLLIAILLVLAFAGGWIVARTGMGTAVDSSSLSDLEREFAERMTGASLVGVFTLAGREDRPSVPDRYDLERVQKVGDELWQFTTRMSYGNVTTAIPIAVPIQWLGDTPMITMTNYDIPGMGAFTVRLLFYGDRYAGTWQATGGGGLMFGRIGPGGAAEPGAGGAGGAG